MAKLNSYKGTVPLGAGITQLNGGNFALIEAGAVQTREDGTRLDTEINELKSLINNASDSIEAIPDEDIIALFNT